MNKRSYDASTSSPRRKAKYSYMLLNHVSVAVELNRILVSEIVNVGSYY